jgi:O-succinylhomoserine sulfhydrylase
MSVTDRQKLGITDGLIRFSVGIEGTDDLIEDFKQALGKIRISPRSIQTNN